jgi:hypothetical protein
MQTLTQKQRRDLVVQHRVTHPALTNYAIAKFFKELGISESTTYSILASFSARGTTERRCGSGRHVEKMPPTRVRTLINSVKTSAITSQNQLARKYGICQSYVCKIIKRDGLRSFKKQRAPVVSEKQVPVQKTRNDRLYRHILSSSVEPQIIMDDESYFTFSGGDMPGNDHYYAYERGSGKNGMEFRRQAKFEEKIMMWIAISPAGISRPYFCPSRGALNAASYQRKCITQRLVPFIHLYHQDNNYLFWPDLASCHYAGSTMQLLQQLRIVVVDKAMNPPNCPQLRPIEDFWGILKQLVYAKGWHAKSHQQLKRRILLCLAKVDINVVRNMMCNVKRRIREARAEGMDALIH